MEQVNFSDNFNRIIGILVITDAKHILKLLLLHRTISIVNTDVHLFLEAEHLFSLKRFSKQKLKKLGKEEQVLKEKQLFKEISASAGVPQVLCTCADRTHVGILLNTLISCPIASILNSPLDESSARFCAASVVVALEELHKVILTPTNCFNIMRLEIDLFNFYNSGWHSLQRGITRSSNVCTNRTCAGVFPVNRPVRYYLQYIEVENRRGQIG